MRRQQYDLDSPGTVFANIIFLSMFSLGRINVMSRSIALFVPAGDNRINSGPESKPRTPLPPVFIAVSVGKASGDEK